MSYSVVIPTTGLSGWAYLQRTREHQQEALNNSVRELRLTDGFAERIASVTSAEELFDDRDLREVALSAFGLQDDMDSRAFILNVLNSDLGDSDSMANQLADKRYLALATAFGFGATETKPSDDGGIGDQIVLALQNMQSATVAAQADTRQTLEDAKATLAALFADGELTDDERWLSAMGDSDLGAVLASVLNLPDDFATLAEADRLDMLRSRSAQVFGVSEIAEFATPGLYVEYAMSERYLEQNEPAWSADSTFAATVFDALAEAPLALASGAMDTTDLLAEGMINALTDLAGQPGMSDDERWVELLSSPSLRKTFALVVDLPSDFNVMDTADQVAVLRAETLEHFGVSEIADLVLSEPRATLVTQFRGRMEGIRTADGNFAAAIIAAYQDQQFEISVGETDTNLRLALGIERELAMINDDAESTNDTRWYSIMASTSLRTVFEKALGLPDSFGSLDLDQQLEEFKARAEQRFGTSEIADFADEELLDKLTTQFLVGAEIAELLSQSLGASQIALSLLSSAQSGT